MMRGMGFVRPLIIPCWLRRAYSIPTFLLMNILHITKYYPPETGGIETFLQGLAEEQVRLGHAVRVVAHHARSGRATSVETGSGGEVVRARTLGNIAFAPVSPSFFHQLKRACADFRPDILHVHMPNVPAFGVPFCRRNKSRLVVHWHADVVTDRQLSLKALYPLCARLEHLPLARADRVIATSGQYLETSRPLQNVSEKCSVIPLGLDPGRVQPADPAAVARVRGNRPLVLAVGRFSYYKGFDRLIRAIGQVPEAGLCIIGEGPLRGHCLQLVSDLGLGDRVDLPGMLPEEDLWQHYAACDVLCLPSIERTEAFGMVLLEAMACGKPLVTTTVAGSGMSFVNVHELTGLHVPPEDPVALAGALSELVGNPEKAIEMGRAGQKRFRENFAMDAVAQRIDGLYAGF